MIVTATDLQRIMPLATPEDIARFVEPLNAAMVEFDIDNAERAASFIATVAHESAALSAVSENLNYSAESLLRVFPKYFNGFSEAVGYARQPEKIANRVYANRMGNGDEASGDGWRNRGAGLMQTTGADNHNAVAEHFGIPREEVGDWLRTPEGAARSAGFFWQSKKLNELSDKGDFQLVTRKVNGGLNGWKDRVAYYERAQEELW